MQNLITGTKNLDDKRNNSEKCFDVQLQTASSSYGYEFDQCFGPVHYIGKGLYTDKCCLTTAKHTLICNTVERSGWDHSYLVIMDHWFCDGIIGYKSMIQIDVSGIVIHLLCHVFQPNIINIS